MALTAEIVTRTISGETDKRLRISDGHYVRRVSELIGDDTWTKLRVMMRVSFLTDKGTGDYTSYPSWFFGLCTGTDSPPGTASPQHFAGLESNSVLRINNASFGNGVYFTAPVTAVTIPLPTTYKGGAKTSGSFVTISPAPTTISRASLRLPTLYGITFTRNSPTSFSCHALLKPTCTVSEFSDAIDSSSDVPPGVSSGTFSLAPDETTYGELDSVCFSFLGDVDAFEISDLAVKRLA